jgi:putative tricarboxylic transport membrane protein
MRHTIAVLAVLVFVAGVGPGVAAPAYPSKAVECIAPAGAGGGWDLICRLTAKALTDEKIVQVPISTINMPGGSGAVAIAHAMTRRKGDTHTIIAMGSALTATLARRVVPYTYKDVTALATISGDYQAVVVRKDSTFNNLKTLLEVFKRDPGLITVGGGSAPGGLDHLSFAVLAKSQGVEVTKVRYVPLADGATAMTQLLGGAITVLSGTMSDMMAGLEGGQVRVLGVLAPNRLGGALRDIPTAREQGIDVVYVNWRGFYMPPDVPADVVKFWEDAFAKMYRTKTWARIMQDTRWEPFVLTGDKLKKFLDDDLNDTATTLREAGLMR